MAIIWFLEFGHLAHAAGLVAKQAPEVYYAYSGAEFNDQFGPAAIAKLARDRHHQRLVRHTRRWLRYERRHGRIPRKHANSCSNQNAIHPRGAYEGAEACGCNPRPCGGITGTRPGVIILDDPHAEMPTEQARASMLKWHEEHLRRPERI